MDPAPPHGSWGWNGICPRNCLLGGLGPPAKAGVGFGGARQMWRWGEGGGKGRSHPTLSRLTRAGQGTARRWV